jgi:hypothetical protein
MTFADTAMTRADFARELPRFVSEVRRMLPAAEICTYLEQTGRARPHNHIEAPNEDDHLVRIPILAGCGAAGGSLVIDPRSIVEPGGRACPSLGARARDWRTASCESKRIARERDARSRRWQPTVHCDRMSSKERRS